MISLDEITLARGAKILLHQASATIHAGQRVGLVGNNGTGKSSIFALLRGELDPDHGTLTLPPDCPIASVSQDTPSLAQAALEYVLDGNRPFRDAERAIATAENDGDGIAIARAHEAFMLTGGYELPAKAKQLLGGLGFSPEQYEQSVADFSGGWRMRLNLAQALIAPAHLLLLDEPTNHLDLDAIIWLQDFLAGHPATLILISHDRVFLDALCQHIVHIDNKRLESYRGNYSQFERMRHERRVQADTAYARQEQKRADIQSYIDRFRAKATKARQAQSRLKALEKLRSAAPPPQEKSFALSFPTADHYPSPIVRLENATIGYPDRPLFSELSLVLDGTARIGLLGRNGAGKSTIMKALAGTLPLLSGTRDTHKNARIGYFTQHQLDRLNPQQTPLWHMRELLPDRSEQVLRNLLGAYGFGGPQAQSRISDFSGGEKARLALALIIATRPNLLLLDEPSNHLDLAMRDTLGHALLDYRGAMVIISHDRNMLRLSCDQFYLVANGCCRRFDGDIEDYHKHLGQDSGARNFKATNKTVQKSGGKQNPSRARNQLRRPLERTLKRIEKEMDQLEQARAALETQLADPTLYAPENKERLSVTLTRKAANDQALEKTESDWIQTAQKLEASGKELS